MVVDFVAAISTQSGLAVPKKVEAFGAEQTRGKGPVASHSDGTKPLLGARNVGRGR
jgi:hypothetical protein